MLGRHYIDKSDDTETTVSLRYLAPKRLAKEILDEQPQDKVSADISHSQILNELPQNNISSHNEKSKQSDVNESKYPKGNPQNLHCTSRIRKSSKFLDT